MCGICGKITLNIDVDENLIRKMCKVLNHRGPDDEGVYVFRNKRQAVNGKVSVGLGHRRLSIIGRAESCLTKAYLYGLILDRYVKGVYKWFQRILF